MQIVIITQDWIVVIVDGDTDYLAKVNSILRTIELTTYMIAPALAGQLFTFLGFGWTGVFISAWNVLSVILEYFLLAKIYKAYPGLAQKHCQRPPNEVDAEELPFTEHSGNFNSFLNGLKDSFQGWKTYMKHPIRFAGLGLSCLYMTVLGFDNITYGIQFTTLIISLSINLRFLSDAKSATCSSRRSCWYFCSCWGCW